MYSLCRICGDPECEREASVQSVIHDCVCGFAGCEHEQDLDAASAECDARAADLAGLLGERMARTSFAQESGRGDNIVNTIEEITSAETFVPGHYWATDGHSSISLGQCDTHDELLAAVAQVEAQGDPDTADWTGWYVSRG